MTDVARLLEQTLEEEKATDQKLNRLAEGDINMRARPERHGWDNTGPVPCFVDRGGS